MNDKIITKLKAKKQDFITQSKKKENKNIKYLENKHILNKKTGEIKSIKYDLVDKYSKDYNYISSVSNHINQIAIIQNLVPIFLTITLPSQYHPTTTNKKNVRIYNKNFKYSLDDYIEKGYKTIQDNYRKLLRVLTKNNTKNNTKTPYFRIVEYHQDLTPHLHCIIFFPSDVVDKKVNDIDRVIKRMVEIEELGKQYKVEVLRDVEKGAGYLLKYLKKTIKPKNKNDLYLLDGWKKLNNIRLFTHSQTTLNKADFIRVLGDFVYNIEPLIKKTNEYFNRYTHIAKSTEYMIFKNKDIETKKVDVKIKEIQNNLKGNKYIYLVVESKEKKEVISKVTKNYMQGIQKKVNHLIDYILNCNNVNGKINEINKYIIKQKKEFDVIKATLYNKKNIKNLGLNKIKKALAKYDNNFKDVEALLKKILDVNYKIVKQKLAKYDNYEFDFRTKKGNEYFNNYMTLKNKIKNITKKLDVNVLGILDTIENNVIELIEVKYKTLDKEIYRVMKNEVIKVYDKKDVEMIEWKN